MNLITNVDTCVQVSSLVAGPGSPRQCIHADTIVLPCPQFPNVSMEPLYTFFIALQVRVACLEGRRAEDVWWGSDLELTPQSRHFVMKSVAVRITISQEGRANPRLLWRMCCGA